MQTVPIDLRSDAELETLTTLFRVGSTIDEPPAMLAHFAKWFGQRRTADLFLSVSKRGLPQGKYKITRKFTERDRFVRDATGADTDPPNPWRDWKSLEEHEGGILAEMTAQPEPRIFTGFTIDDDPVLGDTLAGMHSAMAIPTYDTGEAINWAISFYRDTAPKDAEFVRQAMIDLNMLGMATRNLVSRREAQHLNTKLTQQLEGIASIQRSLLPQTLPKIPGIDLATSYLTSNEAGGDYYDFFPLQEGRWGVLIADVAGHGAPAATVMAMLRGILHCYERDDFAPASVMEYANIKLLDAGLLGTFVTAFFAIYDPATGTLDYARCGHNPPRVRRTDGSLVALDADAGFPLGVDTPLGVHTAAFKLDPGDTLVLYTDGITEAFDDDRAMFGEHRLDRALRACRPTAQDVIDGIHCKLFEFTGRMERGDDQTLVVMHRPSETAG
ncbi:MAG: PP2C family protein-serine/threonine phosphatase [Planctomycetota bacterium]